MSREVFVIDADASLNEAVAGMAALQIGCLPVVQKGDLVGVITRGDLRRAGIDEALLGARYCASCGSPHGVCPDPRGAVEFCLDCLDRETPAPDDDIGTGD
jgi:hypothetical protein